jgi:hypothetical protein
MNSLLGHFHFLSVDLDDILISSKNEKEHFDHLRQMLTSLKDNKLHARLEKYKFYKKSAEFCTYNLS